MLGLAEAYDGIGQLQHLKGDPHTALEYFQKELDILQRLLEENHPSLGLVYNGIGQVHLSLGDYALALEYFEKDLKMKLKFHHD